MRARRKKHGAQRLDACREKGIVIGSKNELPVGFLPAEIEIGCGKGDFIIEMAKRHPERNYIALEKKDDIALEAAERLDREGLKNVRVMVADAGELETLFAPGDLINLYTNFPDPWAKTRYIKRRLTNRSFLEIYKRLLPVGGCVFFKTDNRILFDYSLSEFRACGYRLENVTNDLHASDFAAENIVTEYETLFSQKGFKINRLEAYIDEKTLETYPPMKWTYTEDEAADKPPEDEADGNNKDIEG